MEHFSDRINVGNKQAINWRKFNTCKQKLFLAKLNLRKKKMLRQIFGLLLTDIFGHRTNFVEMLTVSSPPCPVLKIMEHPSLSRALTSCLFKLGYSQPSSLSPLRLPLCSRVLFVLKSHFKSKLDKNEDMMLFLPLLKCPCVENVCSTIKYVCH